MASYSAQLLLSCLAIGLQLRDATSWSFSPNAKPVIATENPDEINFSIMCQADTPLVKCQFNMYPIADYPGDYPSDYPLVDLSQGSSTGEIRRKDLNGTVLFDVSYNGTGLENGQCGASFSNVSLRALHYVCRGADSVGEWNNMDSTIVPNATITAAASIDPRQVVVMPGNHVSILFKTNEAMDKCALMQEMYHSIVFFNESELQILPEHYRYYGTSPLKGECGITLVNVTEADNGPLWFLGRTEDGKLANRISTIIVASPPTNTSFNVDKLTYSVGDTLKATCSSLLSRPVANLTWTLDDRIIRQDTINDELHDDQWSWSWDKANITQTISLNLGEEHFGKNLECKVQHLALTEIQPQLHYLITKT